MWLHHMFWCRVIGEDYDGFVMNSNLYLLTLKGDELMRPSNEASGWSKRTTFVQMLLHHYVWWGRLENYDKFEGIWTSTCLSFKSKLTMIFVFFMISQWGIWVWWFPNVTQLGLGIFYIEWCTMMMIFVQVFSQLGFLGLYFSVQSKMVSWVLVSRIGLRGVFDLLVA